MQFTAAHRWDVSPSCAREIQHQLAQEVIIEDRFGPVRRVAGIDVGFEDGGRMTRAAVVCLEFPSLKPLESHIARRPTVFPYVPGLLSFRELPAVLDALAQVGDTPDLVLCDGQGIAHPRRFGIACHLGVITGLATIGVGKSKLVGEYRQPGPRKGEVSELTHRGERIGTVLRSRDRVNPIFVSPGHRVSHDSAVELVLACTPRFRLPETTRLADRLASTRKARC